MGLDMYLVCREKNNNEERRDIGYWRKANQIFGWFENNLKSVKERPITEEDKKEMTQIELAGGYEILNCTEYKVEKEELEKLFNECKAVIKAYKENGGKLEIEAVGDLCPRSGFFFGDYVIDDWYISQLKETTKILSEILYLDSVDFDKEDVYFSAWW